MRPIRVHVFTGIGTAAPQSQLSELWVEPGGERELLYGVGGRRLMPDPAETYRVTAIKVTGFSDGYTLVDSGEQEWSAKFPRAPFIRTVVDGKVKFHFGGRYKKLLDNITVADVAWICERLNRMTDRQWRDAFRAGGLEASLATRYVARIKARAAEGLAMTR